MTATVGAARVNAGPRPSPRPLRQAALRLTQLDQEHIPSMSSAQPSTYDLFLSYAHHDDHDGWVAAFVAAIQEEHAKFSALALRVFFDRSEIRTMDDWEHRILGALRGSSVMLAED